MGEGICCVAERIDKLRAQMYQQGLTAVVVTRPENVYYLSNFNPIIISHPVYVLVQLDRPALLLVHALRHDHAVAEGALPVALYGHWGEHETLAMEPFHALRQLLERGPHCIGLESDYMSLQTMEQLKHWTGFEQYQDVAPTLRKMRLIKDRQEIDLLRKAAQLADLGVKTAIEQLRAGDSEAGACTEGQYQMRKLWQSAFSEYEISGFGSSQSAQIDALSVWCVSNERIAYGCDCPKNRIPQGGDLVLPMCWARLGGYAAENERTLLCGQVEGLPRRAYTAMLKAREAMFSRLRPGETFEGLYLAAAKIYEDAGFGSLLPGRCGHGMGLSQHEYPSVERGNTLPLEAGMVFTVEPGIMTRSWGGVRHSDTIVITIEGYERLTQLEGGILTL